MAVKTKAQLRAYWDSNLNTNGVQAITGSTLNEGGNDIIDSMALEADVAKVKYSSSIDSAQYLINKVDEGTGIKFASVNDATYGDQLQIAVDNSVFVPYTGALNNLDLGLFDLTATDIKSETAEFGEFATGDYAEFGSTGELRLYGAATQWDDIRVPLSATKLGGSKDPSFAKSFDNGAGSQGVFNWQFSATVEQEMFFSVQMPHTWMSGSDILPHVHWYPPVNGTAGTDVCWGLEYNWTNVGSVIGNTTIIYGDVNHLSETLVAKKHYITSLGTITATGKTLSSMLMCRVFRDATGIGGTDDYANTAGLLEIDFHYQKDSLGSNEEYTKY